MSNSEPSPAETRQIPAPADRSAENTDGLDHTIESPEELFQRMFSDDLEPEPTPAQQRKVDRPD